MKSQILFAMVVNLALLATVGGETKSRQEVPRPNWDVKFSSGSLPLEKNIWLKAAFFSENPEHQWNPLLAISRDQMLAVYFNSEAQKNSAVVQRMPRSGCHQADGLMPPGKSAPVPEMFLVWAATPGVLARAHARLNGRYPVRLVWSEKGVQKELELTVDYCEYASFLANLRWFAGDRWPAIGREFPR